MVTKRTAQLMTIIFTLASLPAFAQFNTRPDPSTSIGPNYIPEGTRFVVKLDDTLDSKKLKPGKKFNLKLAEDLTAPNGAVVPAGKKIHAHVSDIDNGMHGRILISFDEIETRHGWRPLIASVSDVPGEHSAKANEEGEIESETVIHFVNRASDAIYALARFADVDDPALFEGRGKG